MSDTDTSKGTRPSGKMRFVLPGILAVAGAACGFYLSQSGLLPFAGNDSHQSAEPPSEATPPPIPDIAYVPLDPITISLVGQSGMQHLRFRAQLEVNKGFMGEVELLTPRIIDLMNGYLRAVEPSDLTDSLALTRLRGQLLRRINIVAGEGRVRDLLVMEFVIS